MYIRGICHTYTAAVHIVHYDEIYMVYTDYRVPGPDQLGKAACGLGAAAPGPLCRRLPPGPARPLFRPARGSCQCVAVRAVGTRRQRPSSHATSAACRPACVFLQTVLMRRRRRTPPAPPVGDSVRVHDQHRLRDFTPAHWQRGNVTSGWARPRLSRRNLKH